MMSNELIADDEQVFEHVLAHDSRVQHEFDQLNQLLDSINEIPANELQDVADPSWRINDYEVSRWRIVVKGNTRLDRIAHFRAELQQREDIIDARVERFDGGEIAIRLVTTGGIPMGPLERAVWALTRNGSTISPAN
ncbi:MAG: hypothetical protein EA415_11850 [Sphaerobacteraceae bacterium]|nr:MAG: hypothetical protein EA415_11850 [Sphaerobacteraceae bacterium]